MQLYSFLYTDRFTFFKRKYINRDNAYSELSSNEVSFKPLRLEEINAIYNESRIIVDFSSVSQTGLSMRTVEALGHRCKLVTNNAYVRQADFYDNNNVYIYDDKFNLPIEFIKTEYKEIPETIYKYYSLKGWLESIIDAV